jgi:hypothetical protein
MRLHKRSNTTYSRLCVILMSDRVETSISLLDAVGKPHIVFETSAPIDLRAEGKPLLTSLTAALTAACEELLAEALPHIISKSLAHGHFDAIEVFYAAPWYLSRGRQVTIERSQTTPLTEKALHDLIAQNIKGLLPDDMKDIVMLEEHARGFTINGYAVEDPIGTTGREIGMRLFVSAIDGATKESIEKTLHQHFQARTTGHHSTLFSVVQVLAGLKKNDDPYLLVDVSGHMTEVSRVDRGMVLDTISFPEGFETTMTRTAESLKRRPEEVRTILKRPNDFGLAKEFDIARNESLARWSEKYAQAIHSLGNSGLPLMTILIADTPLKDSFKREVVRLGGGSVFAVAKEAYHSFYEAAARPYAHTLSALLSLF